MNSLAETLTPVVENTGFTLVEEDDVAFSLSLCREVHRIYGAYIQGELDATESVWAGLSLTLKMLTTLQGAVTDGMPAMRIQVAAAQAKEMNAVLFGRLNGLDAGWRAPVPPVVAAPPMWGIGPAPEPADRDESRDAGAGDTGVAAPAIALPALDRPPVAARTPLRARYAARWRRVPLLLRIVAGLIGCCLLAVAIDVPLAVMALFPNLVVPLAAGFVGLPLVIRAVRRLRSHAGGGRLTPHPL